MFMDRSGLSRLIPIVLVVIIVIVAVAALISVGRALFGGEGSPSPLPLVNNGKESLTNTNADRSVRMTARGPITAEETFRSFKIDISPNKRVMTTYKGYVGEVIENNEYENSIPAYTQFVNALSRAELMNGTPLTGEANNTNGICATGTLYEFEVRKGSDTVQKLWTSTCKGTVGSLDASVSQVKRLFQVQIPDYSKLVNKARINV